MPRRLNGPVKNERVDDDVRLITPYGHEHKFSVRLIDRSKQPPISNLYHFWLNEFIVIIIETFISISLSLRVINEPHFFFYSIKKKETPWSDVSEQHLFLSPFYLFIWTSYPLQITTNKLFFCKNDDAQIRRTVGGPEKRCRWALAPPPPPPPPDCCCWLSPL